MATPQIDLTRADINRANSQHSTGPITPEGKEAVRLNALKTGIYARTVLLPNEDPAEYQEHARIYASLYHAEAEQEVELVNAIIEDHWRVRRLARIETNLFEFCALQHLEASDKLIQVRYGTVDSSRLYFIAEVCGFYANHKVFDLLTRQQNRLYRLIDKNEKEVRRLIAARKAQSAAPSEPATGFVSSEPSAPPQEPGILEGVPRRILDLMPNFVGNTAEKHQKEWLKKHWPRG
jgi:hypothetical protein